MPNPYAPSTAGSDAIAFHTTSRRQSLVRRAVGIPLGGVAVCLIAEFVADYFNVHGFRGNTLVSEKLMRAIVAGLLFTVPYFVLSSPLVFLKAETTRHSLAYPVLGGAVGILVPRTMIGYGWEVQAAFGLDTSEVFFFAAGCGSVAGCLAEVSVQMATAAFRSATPSALRGG